MDKNNQEQELSSDSRFKNFLVNLPVIGRVVRIAMGIHAFGKTVTNLFANRDSQGSHSSLPSGVYLIALCTGITATVVSAMIEYEIMVYAYNSQPGILSIPIEMIKFIYRLIFADSLEGLLKFFFGGKTPDLTSTQQEPSKKSLLPLLTVIGLEGSKCIAILYVHSTQEKRSFWGKIPRFFLRSFLVGISLFCSFVFFSLLMNEPNEDAVNQEIEDAKKEILGKIEDIDEIIKNDTIMLDLRNRLEVINSHIDSNLAMETEEVRSGGNGRPARRGPVARGIAETREGIIQMQKDKMEKIEARDQLLRQIARDDADKEIKKKEKSIMKGGRALDPKWMSSALSTLHKVWYSDNESDREGNYPRRWAVIFTLAFSIMVSVALELIINEMFKRIGRVLSSHGEIT